MKVLYSFVILAGLTSITGAAPLQGSKDDLLTLYLISISADRCGFAMTAKQTDIIERETRELAEKLKLQAWETDALYSEADVKFEKQGAKACDRNSPFAKGFSETLKRFTGP